MDYNKNHIILDIKSIIIILLSLLVVGLVIFNHSGKDIEKYEQEIGNLNNKNKELLFINDSLKRATKETIKIVVRFITLLK